jgi:hypothetical protein
MNLIKNKENINFHVHVCELSYFLTRPRFEYCSVHCSDNYFASLINGSLLSYDILYT